VTVVKTTAVKTTMQSIYSFIYIKLTVIVFKKTNWSKNNELMRRRSEDS